MFPRQHSLVDPNISLVDLVPLAVAQHIADFCAMAWLYIIANQTLKFAIIA